MPNLPSASAGSAVGVLFIKPNARGRPSDKAKPGAFRDLELALMAWKLLQTGVGQHGETHQEHSWLRLSEMASGFSAVPS